MKEKTAQALLSVAEKQLEQSLTAERQLVDENERLRAALRRALLGGHPTQQGSGSAAVLLTSGGGEGRHSAESMAYARPARHTVGSARALTLMDDSPTTAVGVVRRMAWV